MRPEGPLYALQQRALKGFSPEEMLEYTFEAMGAFIPFDRVGLAILDGEYLSSKWVKSRVPILHLKIGYRALIHGSSLEAVILSRRPRVISDLEEYLKKHPESKSTALILKDGMRSSLTLPLEIRGRALGVVFFSSTKSNAYTFEHLKILESVAQAMSLVVEEVEVAAKRVEIQNREQFASRVIHDLRSPLAVISSFTDLLLESVDFVALTESSKSMFEVIRRNTQMLLSLVEELSELSTLRGNPTAVHREPVILHSFLNATTAALIPICAAKKIEIKTIFEITDLQSWSFDALRIRQVLENLVSNAVKFAQGGTLVELHVWIESGQLHFAVKDQGQGIPAQELPKLFREFGTTHVRSTAGEKSTGLGLAICKQIVEAHGGKINVTSNPGQGSVFAFWIPSSSIVDSR